MQLFKGSCTAIVTPFTENGKSINYNVFRKLVDFQIENGTNAIVFMGTTGESSTLSKQEKYEVAKWAVDYVGKKLPVIIGAGGNNTAEVIENCKIFEEIGVDGLLLVTPYYNKATQNGLIKHYATIAKSTNLPIILYNVPSRTGVNIEAKTILTLSQIKNIVGVKEASGNFEQIMEILKNVDKNFSVYSGDDSLALPIIAMGGKGVIGVTSNILPKEMSTLCSYALNGNIKKARKLHFDLFPKMKSLFVEVNPIPIKYALKFVGIYPGLPRLPLTEIEEEHKPLLEKMFKK